MLENCVPSFKEVLCDPQLNISKHLLVLIHHQLLHVEIRLIKVELDLLPESYHSHANCYNDENNSKEAPNALGDVVRDNYRFKDWSPVQADDK